MFNKLSMHYRKDAVVQNSRLLATTRHPVAAQVVAVGNPQDYAKVAMVLKLWKDGNLKAKCHVSSAEGRAIGRRTALEWRISMMAASVYY